MAKGLDPTPFLDVSNNHLRTAAVRAFGGDIEAERYLDARGEAGRADEPWRGEGREELPPGPRHDPLQAADHYSALGVPRHASVEIIQRVYRTLSQMYKVDGKARLADNETRQQRERQMAALKVAHDVLASPRRRFAYDHSLGVEPEAIVTTMPPEPLVAAPPQRRPPDPRDWDFDFEGDGRPFRMARGKASRVNGGKHVAQAGRAQLRGELAMDFACVGEVVRHAGKVSPFPGLGERGESNRLAQPGLRAQFRDFIVERVRQGLRDGAPWCERGLRYASLGCGELLFDCELLERIRAAGARISQVCLVDPEYNDPRGNTRCALREFADWMAASAQMSKEEPAEILVFGHLSDYHANVSVSGGRISLCDVLVHCDAYWDGVIEDCERLALQVLEPGGLLLRLSNHGGPQLLRVAAPPDNEFHGDKKNLTRVIFEDSPFSSAAWVLRAGSHPFLEAVDDPLLGSTTSSLRHLASSLCLHNLGYSVWRVVHKPRIAVRSKPAAQAAAVDVLYAGDEVIVTAERQGPWLRISEHSGLPSKSQEAWVLSEGSAVGLGQLLEQIW